MRERIVAIAALLVTSAAVHAQAPASSGLTRLVTSRDTVISATAGLELDVNKASGRLTIRAWDRPDVRIRVIGAMDDPYDVTISAQALSIRSRRANDAGSEYELTIPRDMVSGVGTRDAHVSIVGTRGRMHAVVLNGTLTATDISGPTKLEVLNGNVVVRRSTGPLMIIAPNQHVVVEEARGQMSVRSINGDISLERVVLDGMDVQTYSGAIRVSGTLRGPSGFSASSFTGDIMLSIDGRTGLRANVATSRGSVHWPTNARFSGDAARQKGVVIIGGGKAKVTLETFRGRIEISEK